MVLGAALAIACGSSGGGGETAGDASAEGSDSATASGATLSSTSGISASGGSAETGGSGGSNGTDSAGESQDSNDADDSTTSDATGGSGGTTTADDESGGSETGEVPTDMPGELVFEEASKIEDGWYQYYQGSTQYRPSGEFFALAMRGGVAHLVNQSSSSTSGIVHRENSKGAWTSSPNVTDPGVGYIPNSLAVALDFRDEPSVAIGGRHYVNYPSFVSSAHAYFYDGYIWQIAHPTPSTSGPGPQSIDMAIDSTGQRHVVYVARWEGNDASLVYANGDATGQSWSHEALELDRDVEPGSGTIAIALDENDGIHIAYSHENPSAMGNQADTMITYASTASAAAPWTFQVVEDYLIIRSRIDLAVSDDGVPHVVFAEDMNSGIWHTTPVDGAWSAELVDDDGSVGYGHSIAVDRFGRPHISHVDVEANTIRYGRLLDGGWDLYAPAETYPPGQGSCGGCRTDIHTDLALDEDGAPVIGVGGFDLSVVTAAVP